MMLKKNPNPFLLGTRNSTVSHRSELRKSRNAVARSGVVLRYSSSHKANAQKYLFTISSINGHTTSRAFSSGIDHYSGNQYPLQHPS
mmetsp:Transcript_26100/g.71586  ORF Transcript_26100/g.71586 Transcript_26100/m.71586 type:complete len:87 (-) Transcript_26100:45-305(-)